MAVVQQTSRDPHSHDPRPRMVQGGGLSAGCQDRVHRALTYELTASALISPLAANSIGHRYVRLNASLQDLRGLGGGAGQECQVGNEDSPSQCSDQGPAPSSHFHFSISFLLSANCFRSPPILTVLCPGCSLCLEHPSRCPLYSACLSWPGPLGAPGAAFVPGQAGCSGDSGSPFLTPPTHPCLSLPWGWSAGHGCVAESRLLRGAAGLPGACVTEWSPQFHVLKPRPQTSKGDGIWS